MFEFSSKIESVHRLCLLIAIIAICVYLLENSKLVSQLFESALIFHLILSVAIVAIDHLIVASGFHYAHVGLGINRNLSQSLRSYFIRLPARYIPGGIWHTAARYLDVRSDIDLPKRKFAQIFVTETLLVAASGFLIAGVLSRYFIHQRDWLFSVSAYSLAGGAIFSLIFLLMLQRLKGSSSASKLMLSASFFVSHWVIVGLAFAVYARGLTGSLAECSVGVLASAYDLAASLGYIAIFAPQGWGVTEFVFAKVSSCHVAVPIGVAAVVGFRVVGLVSDLIAFSIAMFIETKISAKRSK